MRKCSIRFTFILVVLFTFLVGLLTPYQTEAQTANIPEVEKILTISKPVQGQFESNEQVHWYTIELKEKEMEDFTHYRIKFQSEQEMNVTVYSSLENAVDNIAFERYMGYSFQNEEAMIDFPIGWEGPYYIKVEHFAGEEPPVLEEEGEIPAPVYTIGYDGVTLPPSDGVIGEECPAELSTKERKNGKNILIDLRTIREDVLAKTDKGKEITAMYYKMAPFLSAKMVLSKSLKDQVYQDLVQLKPLFADVAKNGSVSTYKITSKDQEAINRLYASALDSVPAYLKKEMEKTGKQTGISNLTNSTVEAILKKAGLALPKASDSSRLIVKLKEGKKLSAIQSKIKSYGIQSVDKLDVKPTALPNTYVVETNSNTSASKMVKGQISKLPEVEFIEPVQEYKSLTVDSQFSYQWSLENEGRDGGKEGADIQYEELQELLKDKKLNDTVIAVVDTGVDHTLADLNGKVLADKGYNYIANNNDTMDDNGHGTHVSGIIAAKADNHYSMAGINSHSKILPVKVLDANGSGDTESIAFGIIYAVDHGAKVINLSLGGPYSRTIEYSLKYANEHGVTVVAASGNDGFEEVSYPASSKYATAVGATNRLDIVSDFSNYGRGIDLVAPGTDIPSLLPDGNVTYMTGTSMAAPHVAAVAGLILSHNPDLTPKEVEKILTKSAQDVKLEDEDNSMNGASYDEDPASDYDNVSGWGRLNAPQAILAINKANEITMERIAGSDRFETAVSLSKNGWEESEVAVLATGHNYPDALSATPLAYRYNAPLLLTDTNKVPATVKEELERLNVSKVVVIGGTSVITPNVEKELKSLGIKTITRISGKDRFETSVKIAEELGEVFGAVVANGNGYADALSIAPIASTLEMPILLTNKDKVPDSIRDYVKSSAIEVSYVIGGEQAVSNKAAELFPNYERLSGKTRYETNSMVIDYFSDTLDMSTPFIATGENYPDALSGSALAAVYGSPLILTNPSGAKQTTKDTVAAYADYVSMYYIIGGETALPNKAVEALFQ
ncbi:cell wall-binding repeat-containing protein [Metabacillus litoralis]|uniref:cell wall-binding repeat-containing protein n=1 Tax=Metabacillus litoralis TaxID=152268 RepID=UPI00203C09CE|nr:cell wall-binding repeat-containing protein [Metabacillus litoralis]MCM3653247.1 cell wall-binding repeat-containing protein [Metabacillus litoralis]